MCSRYTLQATPEELARMFGAEIADGSLFAPRYNIAPSQDVVAVRVQPGTTKRELVRLHWGLIPSWAKDKRIAFSTINAKAETVATTPSFRAAFRARRCLIPASGFYEWQVQGRQKQPMYIRRRDRRPLAFAGLWERWAPDGGIPIDSCTIITTGANALMRPIHNRMPVILAAEACDQWLDPAATPPDLHALLKPAAEEELEAYAVRTLVNNPRHDQPQCVEPA